MELQFAPEHLAFRDEVRAFLAAELPQHLRDAGRASPSPFMEVEQALEWQRILGKRGWAAYNWPQHAGGTGWSPVQRYLFEKECALADAPAVPIHGLKLIGPIIAHFGTPEQRARFLPPIVDGTELWCQGYSEPGSGSDLASLSTRAVRDGNQYRITGSKIWTSMAQFADWMFCLVRTDPSVKPQAGITFLLVPMKQPGITIRPIIGMAGDYELNQVFLDDAVCDVDCRLGEEGEGWAIAKFLLENERGGSCTAPRLIADLAHLAAEAAALPCGRGSLAEEPEFARKLARACLEAEALEMTELRILAELEAGRNPGPQTSLVKLVSANLRQRIDELALEAHGHDALQLATQRPLFGNTAPEPVGAKAAQMAMPCYLNNRAYTIFGGTNEVQKTIIARTVLGL
ncbi:acyl-CoA dehydrogenase [alpha proteobacterium AAP81b]|nr:acyl-CoA dehydrogenase [alpha proteobacterium AAP81b]